MITPRWTVAIVLAVIAGLMPTTAQAATHRIAIILGNNAGDSTTVPLHYAETDAGKLARALGELGGIAPEDLFLLQGQTLAGVANAFALAKTRAVELQRDPASRVILVFYFSGHSDGEALELGDQRLTFVELKRMLTSVGADLRLVIVDSCKSGALIRVKGGHLGPAFKIRLTDDLASSGEVMLTSSAADEVALESSEIGGSFFTHHFVSGLRGAADASGDGLVTLSEAYHYAYVHTVVATGETDVGTQHPVYDYRLAGEGELVLTELARPTASLVLPAGIERGLVIDVARDQVIAELRSDARPVIAVQPGRYAIRVWRSGVTRAGRITVAANERRSVDWDDLAASDAPATRGKGDADVRTIAAPALRLFAAVGAQRALERDYGAVPSARVELRLPVGLSFAIAFDTRSDRDSNTPGRETSTVALVGYRWSITRGRYSAWLGAELGIGLSILSTPGYDTEYVRSELVGPQAGASVRLTSELSLGLQSAVWAVIGTADRDGGDLVPASWLGAICDF